MPAAKHTYLRSHQLAGEILEFDIGKEEATLREQAATSKSGRAAKTLVKEGRLRTTLVALRSGSALGAHAVEGDVTLHVLRGAFEVRTAERQARATKGSIIALGAGIHHDAVAVRDATVLITTAMR